MEQFELPTDPMLEGVGRVVNTFFNPASKQTAIDLKQKNKKIRSQAEISAKFSCQLNIVDETLVSMGKEQTNNHANEFLSNIAVHNVLRKKFGSSNTKLTNALTEQGASG